MTLEEILRIHQLLIEQFGGISGVRDMNALKSAINRPFATFDQKELYPTPLEKASAILESIVTNHPFLDGNKRTGYVLMRLTLLEAGYDIEASQDEKYEFVIKISKGDSDIEEIKNWLREKIIKEF